MTGLFASPVEAIVIIPAVSAAILAVIPSYKLSSRLNMFSCFATLAAALSLLVGEPARAGGVSAGRRVEYRVYHTQHLCRLHGGDFFGELYRP